MVLMLLSVSLVNPLGIMDALLPILFSSSLAVLGIAALIKANKLTKDSQTRGAYNIFVDIIGERLVMTTAKLLLEDERLIFCKKPLLWVSLKKWFEIPCKSVTDVKPSSPALTIVYRSESTKELERVPFAFANQNWSRESAEEFQRFWVNFREVHPQAMSQAVTVQKEEKTLAERYPLYTGDQARIEGWLTFAALGLLIFPFALAIELWFLFSRSPEEWRLLAPFLSFWLLADIGLGALWVIVVMHFFRKRGTVPILMIAFILSSLLLGIVLVSFAPGILAGELMKDLQGNLVLKFLGCLIWVPYFLVSRHVQLTFVR